MQLRLQVVTLTKCLLAIQQTVEYPQCLLLPHIALANSCLAPAKQSLQRACCGSLCSLLLGALLQQIGTQGISCFQPSTLTMHHLCLVVNSQTRETVTQASRTTT